MTDGKKKTKKDEELLEELGNDEEELTIDEELEQVHQENVQEIQLLREKLEEAESKYKRALADYHNLERVTQESQRRFAKLATQGFVEELVGPYDHLRMAAGHIKDKGLDMVMNQFKQVFESQGLEEIHPLGQQFDPASMEAIDTKEGEDGKVLDVLSVGYILNGIVVKPAKVTVGKSK